MIAFAVIALAVSLVILVFAVCAAAANGDRVFELPPQYVESEKE